MLFADSQLVGTFKGFNEKGLEFAAEIIAPYDASMLDRPQLGQFLLVELGSPEEAALGRITRFVPSGLLARAGYGKSNLIKFLVGELYRQQPKTEKGLDVGTLIFDPDGEYFWPDTVKNRPGLCDVPQLQDKLIVFTNRSAPNAHYGSWQGR